MTRKTAKTRGQKFAAMLRAARDSKLGRMLRSPGMVVFLAGAAVSFDHIRHSATLVGGFTWWQAPLAPIMIDAMLIVAARYITRSTTVTGRVAAFLSFIGGAAATIWCNLLTAPDTTGGRIMAVIPAGAVIATAVMLHWGEMPKAKTRTVAVRSPEEQRVAVTAIGRYRQASKSVPARHRSGDTVPVVA